MKNIVGRAFNEELAERYARWLVAQGYVQATRYYYLSAVASFLRFLGNVAATKTTQVEVQEYIASSAAAGCPAYKLRERLYALRIFFDFLCLGGLMAWSPPRLIHMKRLKRRFPKVLNRVEIKKVMKAARSPREKALVEVLYGTGVRCGELLSVKVREIDFQNRRFMVHGKTGDRTVLFSPRIAGVLKQYLKGRASGYLFALKAVAAMPKVLPTYGGGWRCRYVVHDGAGRQLKQLTLSIPKQQRLSYARAKRVLLSRVCKNPYSRAVGQMPLSDNCIQRDLRLLSARSGVEVTARILRHTFATHMMDNGADLRAVRDFMGHKSLRSTTIYAHMSRVPLRRAYDAYYPDPT